MINLIGVQITYKLIMTGALDFTTFEFDELSHIRAHTLCLDYRI